MEEWSFSLYFLEKKKQKQKATKLLKHEKYECRSKTVVQPGPTVFLKKAHVKKELNFRKKFRIELESHVYAKVTIIVWSLLQKNKLFLYFTVYPKSTDYKRLMKKLINTVPGFEKKL